MTEERKEQIKLSFKTLVTVAIILVSLSGSAYITYDYAKEAKGETKALGSRMTAAETKQARFEGIMDERTRNTAKRVDDIYAIVKEWEPEKHASHKMKK